MPPKESYESLIAILSNHKQEDSFIDIEKMMSSVQYAIFKKNPKSLDYIAIKKVFLENDHLTLILKGHLYIEILMNDIIETDPRCDHKTLKKMYRLLSSTFSNKLKFLYEKGLLDDDLYKDIDAINGYRNKFAHNFEFNICELGVFDNFSLFIGKKIRRKRKKNENEALFRYSIRFAFLYTFDRLYKKFNHLLALKINNKRARYHPLELDS